MDFNTFILEKLDDNHTKEQMDFYWKTIHKFNTWKKNHKNSESILADLNHILDDMILPPKSLQKINDMIDMVSGNKNVPEIKHLTNNKSSNNSKYEQNDDDFNTIDINQDFIEKAFNKFNQKYFNGVLNPIPMEIVNENGGAAGSFLANTDYMHRKITPISIKLTKSDCDISFSSFRNTLVHEMLHYYVHCYMPLDPNPTTDEQLWFDALRFVTRGQKRKAWRILEVTNDFSHGKRWLKLSKELNKKYPELTITKNSFVSSNGLRGGDNQLELVNKMKNASLFKITAHRILSNYSIRDIVTYKILSNEYIDFYKKFINRSPITESDFHDLNDNWSSWDIFGTSLDNLISVDIDFAPIIKHQASIEFVPGNLNPDCYIDYNGDMLKQMKHAKLFGSFKNIGKIKMNVNKLNNESYLLSDDSFDSFSSWMNNNIITEKSINKR